MKWVCVLCVTMVQVFATTTVVSAKKKSTEPLNVEESPRTDVPLPSDIAGKLSGLQRAAAADTFVLHTENFDDGTMAPYVGVDFTAQLGTFFHVADATELDGGLSGNLNPLSGAKSMWCGVSPTATVPFCGWPALPGYGDDWDQILESELLPGDSLSLSYKVFWDSEPGYDYTVVEYNFDTGPNWDWYWQAFPVNNPWSSYSGIYDNSPPPPYITESFVVHSPTKTNVRVRFRFKSDDAGSGEDGLWPTDGAILVDDIGVATWIDGAPAFNDSEDFESAAVGSNTAGIWTGKPGSAFGGPTVPTHPAYGTGQYGALYPGILLLQEDPCLFVTSFVVAFFDDPSVTNYFSHEPDPRLDVGAIPYGTPEGIYMDNEVVSPVFPNLGYGNEFRLEFSVYRDLPLDGLIFYYWRVRSWVAGCPSQWKNDNFVYYGGRKDWFRTSFPIGPRVDSSADGFQVSVGARDLCGIWCATEAWHSHAPLIDEIRVIRVGTSTPQYVLHHSTGLFQDNFSQNGTLTGTARADCATDILPSTSVSSIVPGDSVSMVIAPVGGAGPGTGPNAYAYVRVKRRPASPPLSGAVLGSNQVRKAPQPTAYGTRWPFVGTTNVDGITWSCFRMDTAFTTLGAPVANRFCVDLNDNVFLPGDTIFYFYGADVDNATNSGNEGYFTRSVNGQGNNVVTSDIAAAAASPCECTILPSRGLIAGNDILYVDDQDDRGGPGQLYWDSAFEMVSKTKGRVDRFDVLAPSSVVDNSLASRVKNNVTQIVNVYEHILWDSGDLSSGLIGDGTGAPEKSNDWGLLFTFLNTGTVGNGPGLYLSGDDIAEEWVTLGGTGAIQVRSSYMTFNLVSNSHVGHGEAMSPHMTAAGSSFIHAGVPDEMIAHAGCPLINDFDVLDPTGTAEIAFPYPTSGDGAIISKTTTNVNAETAVVILSGFSYTSIRDASETPPQSSGLQGAPPIFPPARVELLRDMLIKFGNCACSVTGVEPDGMPDYANVLHNNYPNPFNPVTTIRYGIRERGHVSLRIYNAAGQMVKSLVDEVQEPDAIEPVTWDGRNDTGQSVASGIYFYKLATNSFSQTRKMVLLR